MLSRVSECYSAPFLAVRMNKVLVSPQSLGSCIESIAAVIQLALVWVLFVLMYVHHSPLLDILILTLRSFVLYMIYYPPRRKYVELDVDLPNHLPARHIKTAVKHEEWKLSITLSWVVLFHMYVIVFTHWPLSALRCLGLHRWRSFRFRNAGHKALEYSLHIALTVYLHHDRAFIIFITFMLLMTNPTPDATHRSPQLQLWATFLGVSSALLAAFQYAPQIAHTFRIQLVGALSIPMMCIQTPGAILMVLSIALRPGTNWTSTSFVLYPPRVSHSPATYSLDPVRCRRRDARHPPRHVYYLPHTAAQARPGRLRSPARWLGCLCPVTPIRV